MHSFLDTYELPGAEERDRQLASFTSRVPTARAITSDRSQFEVPLPGCNAALRINLPFGFPTDPPQLTVSGPVRHAWVDTTGRVKFEGLRNWGRGSSLADVAETVASTLISAAAPPPVASPYAQPVQTSPEGASSYYYGQPAPVAQPAPSATGARPVAVPVARPVSGRPGPIPVATAMPGGGERGGGGMGGLVAGAGGSTEPVTLGGSIRMPGVPAEFPELQRMGADELRRLISDAGAFQSLVDRLSTEHNIADVKADLLKENEEAARANLAQEEEVKALEASIAQLRNREYPKAAAELQERAAKQAAVAARVAPERLITRLEAAAREVDEASEEVATALAAGDLPPDQFVKNYVEMRKVFHERDIKRMHLI